MSEAKPSTEDEISDLSVLEAGAYSTQQGEHLQFIHFSTFYLIHGGNSESL